MNTQDVDTAYEWKAVVMLALGFGLVGLDRCIIMPLFPAMMADLHLNYQDVGNISGALAIAWGVSSLFMGGLSDHFGRRKVIIPAVIGFSALAGVSGMATGALNLLLIRALMGISEGAYTPASIAATIEASRPSRRGFNLGIQQTSFPLFGLALGPVIATQLLDVLPSWRWVFILVSAPGLILAMVMVRNLRDTQAARPEGAEAGSHWRQVLRYRNVWLNMLGMFCLCTCLYVVSAMVANYLTDYLHLGMAEMGFIMSAIGFGGFSGQVIMPGLSDRFGRKPVVLFSYAAGTLSLIGLMATGAQPVLLFALLFMTAFGTFSVICMTVGPMTTEAVPPSLMSTASGLVIGVGEIFGGGVAPGLAGYVAQNFGIQYTLHLALAGLVLGTIIGLGLRETAPQAAVGIQA